MYSSDTMIYTLKILFITLRLGGIVFWEPAAFSVDDFADVGINGARVACQKMKVNKDIAFSAIIRINSHGNGGLQLANLKYVDVYDSHGNGDLYRNWLLNIKFADFDGDGYRDLVIYGIVDFYGEKDDDLKHILTSRPVIKLYRFNPKSREFDKVFIYDPTWYDLYDKDKEQTPIYPFNDI